MLISLSASDPTLERSGLQRLTHINYTFRERAKVGVVPHLEEEIMSANPAEFGLTAWKRQMDVALQVAEVMVEGAETAREIQLAAGVDAHAWLEASRKALADAPGVTEVAALESRLATENLGKVAQYWARLAANARDTQTRIFTLLLDQSAAPLLSVQPQAPASQGALIGIIDAGYKQWLETLRALYATTATAGSA